MGLPSHHDCADCTGCWHRGFDQIHIEKMIKRTPKGVFFRAGFLALSLISASPVSADMNIEDFTEYTKASPESAEVALLYLNAAFSAFQVSNLKLEERNQTQIFCMDGTHRLTEQQMANWVEDAIQVASLPNGNDIPVTIVLLDVLVQRFPCKQ